jgi:hypothetical protein
MPPPTDLSSASAIFTYLTKREANVTLFTNQKNMTTNALASAHGVFGYVRPGMGLDLNSSELINDLGPKTLRQVLIRI